MGEDEESTGGGGGFELEIRLYIYTCTCEAVHQSERPIKLIGFRRCHATTRPSIFVGAFRLLPRFPYTAVQPLLRTRTHTLRRLTSFDRGGNCRKSLRVGRVFFFFVSYIFFLRVWPVSRTRPCQNRIMSVQKISLCTRHFRREHWNGRTIARKIYILLSGRGH